MDIHSSVSLSEIDSFSSLFVDYINQSRKLSSFYREEPSIDGIFNILKQRKFSQTARNILVDTLKSQYHNTSKYDLIDANVELLRNENTFTVTTGHQICIYTGPLYFVYKIITTINICRSLKEHYPDYDFIPIYWMATEDHDLEEVNHFYLFNQKKTWATEQKGAVGRMNPSGIAELFEGFKEDFSSFSQIYANSKTLAISTLQLVNKLFGKYGLVVLEPDHINFKKQFISQIKSDLFDQIAFNELTETNRLLSNLSFETQVNPRAINFFYIKANVRERIVFEHDQFHVLNTDINFTKDQMVQEIENFPDRFSPNVIQRPLYQEVILPNLAYVGGPGEISYWLQLKSFFDRSNVSFPVLMPRNFAMIAAPNLVEKVQKIKLSPADFFKSELQLKAKYISLNSSDQFYKGHYIEQIDGLYQQIQKDIVRIDGSLVGFVDAQLKETKSIVDNIEKKVKKSIERKVEDQLTQLSNLKNKLFPENTLQERHDNFLNFYLSNTSLIDDLLRCLKPFDFQFNILKS